MRFGSSGEPSSLLLPWLVASASRRRATTSKKEEEEEKKRKKKTMTKKKEEEEEKALDETRPPHDRTAIRPTSCMVIAAIFESLSHDETNRFSHIRHVLARTTRVASQCREWITTSFILSLDVGTGVDGSNSHTTRKSRYDSTSRSNDVS